MLRVQFNGLGFSAESDHHCQPITNTMAEMGFCGEAYMAGIRYPSRAALLAAMQGGGGGGPSVVPGGSGGGGSFVFPNPFAPTVPTCVPGTPGCLAVVPTPWYKGPIGIGLIALGLIVGYKKFIAKPAA